MKRTGLEWNTPWKVQEKNNDKRKEPCDMPTAAIVIDN